MKQLLKCIFGSIILGNFIFFHGAAKCQTHGLENSINIISNSSLSNTIGNLAVNSSAGLGNQQENIAAISVSNKIASILISSNQNIIEKYYTCADTTSSIESGALSNIAGIVAVNQVSGNNNIQANLLAIATGSAAEVSIEQLGKIVTYGKPSDAGEGESNIQRINRATISDSALLNSTGIVQINQIAGSGNITANIFTLAVGIMRP